jgi:hypothetical protein
VPQGPSHVCGYAWRDPDAQREFLARIEKYQNEGPPPPENRMSREEIRAQYGV